ncbi:MAG: ABC transporter permease [Methanobacteriota archaeon]
MRLQVIWANLIVNVKSFYREKAAVFFTIAFPIMLILLFGAIFSNTSEIVFDLHVQDMDGTNSSAELVKSLELDGTFIITSVDPGENATTYANDNGVNLVLIIPDGYEDALVQRTVYHNMSSSVQFTYIQDPSASAVQTKLQIIDSVINGMNQGLSGSAPFIVVTSESIYTKEYSYIDFFAPGIIAMSVMTSSLFGAVNINAELRQKGVLRKLSTTPITQTEWILSNIMYQIILAFISTSAILLVAYGAFGVHFNLNGWLLVFVILDVFAFAGIGMLLTRLAKEAESAAAAANAVMFPMMFLSGSFFQLEMMPSFLQTLARFLPLYYVNEGLRASMVSLKWDYVYSHAAVIAVFAGVMFVLGIIFTSWKED